jgi:CO/xanthine dehydrogenase FAD-binding subunit
MGDVFASGEYRLHLAKVYGRRALQAARDRAKG